jgi:hypothetical protein
MAVIAGAKRVIHRLANRRRIKLVDALRLIRERFDGPIPRTLYHYTSADALLSILAKKELWAGNITHLNDARELEHGVEIVSATIKKEITKATERMVKELLKQTQKTLVEMRKEWAQNFYAVSFCSHGDLLSQWRGYGLMGGGYCLGVTPDLLRPEGADGDDAIALRRICYLERDQRRVVTNVLTCAYGYLPRLSLGWKQKIKDMATELAMELFIYFSAFKDQSFEEEKEWRLVYLLPNNAQVKFRAANNALKPYIVVPLKDSKDQVPLLSVRHGPTLNRDVATTSLRLRLSQDYPRVRVYASEVPYRAI